MLKVKDLIRLKGSTVYCVDPDTTIMAALKLMTEKKIGAVPVMENKQVVGIITERDMARVVAEEAECSFDEPVKKHMTKHVFTATPDTTLEECMQMMIDENFRHLPVISGDGLVGLLSIRDLVRVLLTQRDALITDLENYIVGKR